MDFPHLAKLGAYHTTTPYPFLQTAPNAHTVFFQHFSEVSYLYLSIGKPIFQVSLQNIHARHTIIELLALVRVFRCLFSGVK